MENRGVFLMIMSACFVATQAIFVKLAYSTGVNVVTALSIRFIISSLVFFICLLVTGQSMRLPQGSGNLLVILIVIHIVLDALVYMSFNIMPASLAIMFLYAYPAFTGILAFAIQNEKLGSGKIGALIFSGVGLVVLLWGSWNGIIYSGVLMALGAALSYAVYLIFLPGLLTRVHQLTFSAWLFSVSAVVYTLIGLFIGNLDFHFAPVGWLYLVLTSLISSVAATLALFYGLPLVGPTHAAIILTLEPPITAVLGYLVFDERLSAVQLIGAILILFGVVFPHLIKTRDTKNQVTQKTSLKAKPFQ